MTHRTAVLTSYGDYLASEYPDPSAEVASSRTADLLEREARLATHPYSVVLQVAYPEMDYANRWCWQQFGPASGECQQAHSEYSACPLRTAHTHEGRWLTYWLAKTDYDFGFNEWCFSSSTDRDAFLEFFPSVNWGENYPK